MKNFNHKAHKVRKAKIQSVTALISNFAVAGNKGIVQRRTYTNPTTAGDQRLNYGQGRPMAKSSSSGGSAWYLGTQSQPQAFPQGTVESRLAFDGTVSSTNMSLVTDAREAGRIGVFGSSLSYGGSYGRVTSEAIGRDVNPLGRGDGIAYVGGKQSFGVITRPLPMRNYHEGKGNSVNNGSCCDADGGPGNGGSGDVGACGAEWVAEHQEYLERMPCVTQCSPVACEHDELCGPREYLDNPVDCTLKLCKCYADMKGSCRCPLDQSCVRAGVGTYVCGTRIHTCPDTCCDTGNNCKSSASTRFDWCCCDCMESGRCTFDGCKSTLKAVGDMQSGYSSFNWASFMFAFIASIVIGMIGGPLAWLWMISVILLQLIAFAIALRAIETTVLNIQDWTVRRCYGCIKQCLGREFGGKETDELVSLLLWSIIAAFLGEVLAQLPGVAAWIKNLLSKAWGTIIGDLGGAQVNPTNPWDDWTEPLPRAL